MEGLCSRSPYSDGPGTEAEEVKTEAEAKAEETETAGQAVRRRGRPAHFVEPMKQVKLTKEKAELQKRLLPPRFDKKRGPDPETRIRKKP